VFLKFPYEGKSGRSLNAVCFQDHIFGPTNIMENNHATTQPYNGELSGKTKNFVND